MPDAEHSLPGGFGDGKRDVAQARGVDVRDGAAALAHRPSSPRPAPVIAIVQAARAVEYPHMLEPHEPYHAVGGDIRETILRREGCVSSIVHHWPDRIGERINPAASVVAA